MSIDQLFDPVLGSRDYKDYVPQHKKPVEPKCGRESELVSPNITYFRFANKCDNDTSSTKRVSESLEAFRDGMQHKPEADKDGRAIITADFLEFTGQLDARTGKPFKSGRCDAFVSSICALQIDIDNKDRSTNACVQKPITDVEIEAWLNKFGYRGYYYTTFSHTPEWPRYRVVLFLKAPFVIRTSLDDPQGVRREALYKAGYRILSESLCGENWDTTCQNLARLFYCPAYPADDPAAAGNARCGYVEGKLIDFDELVSGVPERKERPKPKRIGGVTADRKRFDHVWRRISPYFDVADFFLRHEQTARDKSGDKCELFCPFDDEHGHPDGKGSGKTPVVAYNPVAAEHGRATVKCLHDACSTRTAGDFVYAIVRKGGLGVR